MQAVANKYQWIGSRRHVSGVPYILPKDDQEFERLDLQHYMLRYVLKGNYLAPIAQPAHVLDVGCGTGRWLVEMAQEFSQADLIGVDLKLPEAGTALFPPNCHFQEGNALDGLSFEDSSFDFVHQRLLIFAIPLLRWQQLVDELVRVTRRGGWVELTEVNPFFEQMGPATERIVDLIVQTMLQRGFDLTISQRMSTLLGTAGLKRVETRVQLIPVGNWGGRLGTMALADIRAIFQAMKPLIVAQMQTPPEEFDRLTMQMEQEVEQYHTTFTFDTAYGQRQ
jgi:ubiquinone/menaquinone biosynthesis C-methylase UbiE